MDPALGPAGGFPPPPDVIALGGAQGAAPSGALVLHGSVAAGKRQYDSDDSDSDDSDGEPPKEVGDVDPSRCKVSGPGFSGTAAGAPVHLYLYAHDAYGRRLQSGGDEVVVRVSPASSSMQLPGPIEVTVLDNGNGTYTATYTPPIKGNYFIAVEVNYLPITGSPFPVFFSNPLSPEEAAAAAAAAAATGGSGAPGAAATPPPMSLDPAVQAMAAAAKQAISGANEQASVAMRTVYLSNMSAGVSLEQYRQLLSIPGKIQDIKQAGEGSNTMLIIEYATVHEADEAVKMNGMAVGDRSLVVQNGVTYQAAQTSVAAMAATPPTAVPLPTGLPAALDPSAAGAALPGMLGLGQGMLPGFGGLSGMAGFPGMPGMAGLGMAGLGMAGLAGTDPMAAMQQLQQLQDLQRMQVRAWVIIMESGTWASWPGCAWQGWQGQTLRCR